MSMIANPEGLSVREWQSFFESVYGTRNGERFAGRHALSRMWLHLVQDMAALAKGIRKNDIALLMRMLPRTFCWLCAFCTRANVSLDEVAWSFFPCVCPTCWSGTCTCGANKRVSRDAPQKDEKTLDEFRILNAAKRPATLDQFVYMFASIYGNHSESVSLTDVYLHFSEEVGEVAEWIRVLETGADSDAFMLAARRNLTSEIADVFSWMCKLCWRIDANLQGFGPWAAYQFRGAFDAQQFQIRFGAITALQYDNGCPACAERACVENCPGWDPQHGPRKDRQREAQRRSELAAPGK